jgi:hypothetical protein
MKTKAKRSDVVKRLSRSTLDKTVVDLRERLAEQVRVVASIRQVIEPNGQTLMACVPMQTVIALALDEHLSKLQGIECVAGILVDRSMPG